MMEILFYVLLALAINSNKLGNTSTISNDAQIDNGTDTDDPAPTGEQ